MWEERGELRRREEGMVEMGCKMQSRVQEGGMRWRLGNMGTEIKVILGERGTEMMAGMKCGPRAQSCYVKKKKKTGMQWL